MERLTERVLGFVQLKSCENDFCKETCAEHDAEKSCNNCPIQKAYEKLAEYEDLEEQGKLLKLYDEYQKIMIGEDIFLIQKSHCKSGKVCHIDEWWNDYQGFQGKYVAMIDGLNYKFKYEDFGKTVFLTKEAAEAALEEMSE